MSFFLIEKSMLFNLFTQKTMSINCLSDHSNYHKRNNNYKCNINTINNKKYIFCNADIIYNGSIGSETAGGNVSSGGSYSKG